MPIQYGHPMTNTAGVQDKSGDDVTARRSRASSEDGEDPAMQNTIFNPYFTGRPRMPTSSTRSGPVDRQDIIRRIKGRDGPKASERSETGRPIRKRKSPSPPILLPSPQLMHNHQTAPDSPEWIAAGLAISRPSSALHKGDFREEQASQWQREHGGDKLSQLDGTGEVQQQSTALSTSPVVPWHPCFSYNATRRSLATSEQYNVPSRHYVEQSRPRAFSQASISGSFTYQPPTSPLVHQSNAADLPDRDFAFNRLSHSPERSRRHTSSPGSLSAHLGNYRQAQCSRTPPFLLRESTYPYQAHQPRRSVTSFNSLPQTPLSGNRRPSISSGSPLQHPMVGSFEESILRGRMSSTPSRPLDFTAQIGVLGMGECKARLKCPPHVIIPFPAVYYSYGSNAVAVESQPSPYVGLVDLENSPGPNKHLDHDRSRRRLKRPSSSRGTSIDSSHDVFSDQSLGRRMQRKQERRSRSPLAVPKGAYRIPPKGQLQIVIKNPHKTAVKLFLVPYDISDMQAGQKTFIRQRSYSAGPVIDMPLNSRKNLGTDRPEAALCLTDDPRDKPILRYLVHLHICCTSRGRYYLYKSMRMVFANRVPDGKEKLRNEIQLPEPKYSVYKPGASANAGLVGDDNVANGRRRQTMYSESIPHGCNEIGSRTSAASSYPAVDVAEGNRFHRETMPSFRFPSLATVDSRPASRGAADDAGDHASPDWHNEGSSSPRSPFSLLSSAQSSGPASSLGRAVVDGLIFAFSRSSSRERPASAKVESLLSKRLRDLEMHGCMAGGT